jgi:suppressor of ftsI
MRLNLNLNTSRAFAVAFALLALSLAPSGVPLHAATREHPAFHNPSEIRSKNGVLKATFDVRECTADIGGRQVQIIAYNGEYMPPTLRLHPGDRIELTLRNSCKRPTNIHFHGFLVSPRDHADNIGVRVDPGEETTYRLTVPKNHSPGLYWYHSHSHGDAQNQVMFGLCGAIVVEGLLEETYPKLLGVEEKILAIRDIQLNPLNQVVQAIVTSDPAVRTVNGLENPRLTARPGQTQFWRISNQSADRYALLKIGGLPFYVIAEDGHRTLKMERQTEYLLGPSARVEILVQFPRAGTYELTTAKIRTGPAGDGYTGATLVTVACEGPGVKPMPLPVEPSSASKPVDLIGSPIAKRRNFVFSDGAADFRINDRTFDMNRIDVHVPLGTIEEWTLRNSSDELHQFHTHQVYFQVVEENGQKVPFTGYRDTYPLPNRGEVKIIVPFLQPDIVGIFPFHCHILEHEDGGMMSLIQVYDPKNPNTPGLPGHVDVSAAPEAKGGAFALQDQKGVRRTESSWPGKALLMAFGYTNCEGACPITMQKIAEVNRILGADQSKLQPVLVTVDPERDTPAVLDAYAKETGLPLSCLTGSKSDLAEVWQRYGVTAERLPANKDGDYGVKHTTSILLVGAGGRIIARFGAANDAAEIAERLRGFFAAEPAKSTTGVASADPQGTAVE